MPDEYVSRQWLIEEYHRRHQGPPGGALKMIEEAPAADVEPKQRWVSVTESLPEPKRKHYLCYLDDDSIAVCYWSNVSIRGNKWEWHNPNWKEVTHWMPLPEPPKMNKEEDK